MRFITLLLTLACSMAAFASDTIQPASYSLSCARVGNNLNLVTYKTQLGGYICGNNVLNTPEKAQKYYWTDSSKTLTAVAFFFGQKQQSGSPGSIRAKVYSVHPTTGAPASLLGQSVTKSVTAIDTSDNLTIVTFLSPILLPDTFFVALDLSLLTAGDSIGLLSTIDSCFSGEQLAWEKDSVSAWFPMNDGTTITSWGLDIDMATFPVGDFGLHTGIEDVDVNKIIVYPNPASEKIFLELKNEDVVAMRLCDLQGKIVFAQRFMRQTGRLEIETTQLSPGVYFLELNNGKKSSTQKIVIAR